MGQAIQMAVFREPNHFNTRKKLDPREEIDRLTTRMKSLAIAASSVKDPADQAQVAMYIRELNLKIMELRKQLL